MEKMDRINLYLMAFLLNNIGKNYRMTCLWLRESRYVLSLFLRRVDVENVSVLWRRGRRRITSSVPATSGGRKMGGDCVHLHKVLNCRSHVAERAWV